MRPITSTLATACAALALTAGLATAQTVPPDRLTYVTFSGPVSVPGMTLPGGTYAFKIMDSNADRHIVQIFNREQTKLFTTLLAVPATRPEPTGDPVITFKETRSDQPPAVHYWYYAGDLAGNELVYPKQQAQMIANASGETVMSVDSEGKTIDDWKKGNLSRVKPTDTTTTQSSTSSSTAASTTTDTSAQQPQSSATASSTTTQPATTTADQSSHPATTTADQSAQPTTAPRASSTTMDQSAQPTTAPTTAPATDNQTAGTSGHTAAPRSSLPKTASELPLVGLIGLLALGGALTLRVARTA